MTEDQQAQPEDTAVVKLDDEKVAWQKKQIAAAVGNKSKVDLIAHTLNAHRSKERQVRRAIKRYPKNPLGTLQGLVEMICFILFALLMFQQML
jgi:hypothetical protein